MKFLESFLPNSLTHSYGLDLTILFVLFILSAGYGLYRGKSKLVSLIISFYPAILLFLNFPYTSDLTLFKATASQVFFSKCLIFLLFLIPIHLVLNKFIFGDFGYGTSRKMIQISVLSLCVLILMVVFFYRIVPLKDIYSVSLPVSRYLATSSDFFFWLLVPFIGLFLTR